MSGDTPDRRRRRSDGRWLWLMADLSLDRARPVLPSLDFPPVDIVAVQAAIRSAGDSLAPGAPYMRTVHPIVLQSLNRQLGVGATSVEHWLDRFPCDDAPARPATNYWHRRFVDMFIADEASAPPEVGSVLWAAMRDAFRLEPGGLAIEPGLRLGGADDLAAAISSYERAKKAIEAARETPLSAYDLDVYVRFGWNDFGAQKGLGSLELGATLMFVTRFWRVFAPLVSNDGLAAIETLAFKRDLDVWRSAQTDPSLEADAQRYGRTRAQLVADLFPKPGPPPRLEALLTE